MRKVITLMSILISTCIYAQHVPLKHIDVADNYATKIQLDNSYNFTNTIEICSASFALASYKISHEKGVKYPDQDYNLWNISLRLDSDESAALKSKAKMQDGLGNLSVGISKLLLVIGESKYNISTWYYSSDNNYLMIDVTKNIAEHISISGFQSIFVENHEVVPFNDIEQELWRRSAKEVYNRRKHL